MEGFDKNDDFERNDKDEIFSKAVRAGKRTYFFDVKATRKNDFYLTVTESKKRFEDDGRFFFEKHKIFLYKEDFDKFSEGLAEAVDFIKNAQQENVKQQSDEESFATVSSSKFSDLDFEDLNE
ncbi:MAG TPA: DNA-binding protein [Marinilabiliaceae bacterium]|nr:DNA-binding protein [Marinilabiliaceae bacterium]